MKKLYRFAFGAVALLPVIALAVTIEFDIGNVPENDLAGFNVYRSTQSGQYGSAAKVGTVPANNPAGGQRYRVSQPNPSSYGRYHYVVTAFDTQGNESVYSAEGTFDFLDRTAPPVPGSLTVTADGS